MIAENWNSFDGLELIHVSDTDSIWPISRIQAKNRRTSRQITQVYPSCERVNVDGRVMNRCIERKIQLWRNFRGVDVVSWRDDPMLRQALARLPRGGSLWQVHFGRFCASCP